MDALAHLAWPFFEERHRSFARALEDWAQRHLRDGHGAEVDAACRALVRALGDAGWLRHAVAGIAYGGAGEAIDTRTVCLARETLARWQARRDRRSWSARQIRRAMISRVNTAMNASNPCGKLPNAHQPKKASSATATTAGTKYAVT